MFDTLQDTFDHVAKSLLEQNAKSLDREEDGGTCMYRGDGGRKCAAGFLIPDENYQWKFEFEPISELIDNYGAEQVFGHQITNTQYDLIVALQLVHDRHRVDEWPVELNRVASAFHLESFPRLSPAAA